MAIGLLLAATGTAPAQTGDAPAPLPSLRPLHLALHPSVELDRLTPLLDDRATFARLRRAAELTLDLAILAEDDPDGRVRLLEEAESYARQALELRPGDLDARFLMGAAMGLRVQYMPTRAKMRMAERIQSISDAILAEDPTHAGGLHLRGQLNAAAMRLSALERFIGRTVLGGGTLGDASWETAEQSFRGAIRSEPDNPAHRWELARVLRDTGREDEARAELRTLLDMDGHQELLAFYRAKARAALRPD